MLIQQVADTLVCTSRHAGLGHMHLRVLRDHQGKLSVAVDPVGAHEGNWVFTVSGSAARFAARNFEILTDLTICGIIDHWDEPAAEDTNATSEPGRGDEPTAY